MDFATLSDTPLELATASEGVEVSEHPVARLGRFRDPRYGKFAITLAMYESWARNLAESQNGRVAIDYDHLAERSGGSTKAAGWITKLRLEGDRVMARIEWTPEGAEAVRNRYYLFVSPSFVEHYKDEQGTDRGPALLGVALTNRPFLQKGMPALSLSKGADEMVEGSFGEAVEETSGAEHEPGAIVPPRMPELSKIAEALSLSADSDEDAILAAIADATKEPDEPKTLAEQAESEGKVVLSRDEVTQLQADAKRGKEAADELLEQKFELAYSKALDEGRIDAVDETKADWHALYEAAPEKTLARIAALPKLARTTGRSSGHTEEAPDGVDEESFLLNRKVEARMGEKGEDYMTALAAVIDETERVAA